MRLKSLLPALAVLLAAAPAQAQAPAQENQAVLAPGDAIKITVWRKEELSGEFPLGPDGTILHPLYRGINAAGVPMAVIEERLMEYLRRMESNPQFVVQPLFRVAVVGNVRTPALYSLPPGTTAAQAIAMAGGPSDRGRLERVRMMRDGTTQVLDLTRAGPAAGGMVMRSGDQLLVPARTNIYRDYIAPASGLMAVAVSLYGIILQQRDNNP
jgi:protein involved in polysaccharide export with SLBB domain